MDTITDSMGMELSDLAHSAAKVLRCSMRDAETAQRKALRVCEYLDPVNGMGSVVACSVRNARGREALLAVRDTRSYYSDTAIWKENHGNVVFLLSPRQARDLEFDSGGCPFVLRGDYPDNNRIIECEYIRKIWKKNGFDTYWRNGYITGNRVFSTVGECIEWRSMRARKLRSLRFADASVKGVRSRFVGLYHCKMAGLCKEGVLDFATYNDLNPDYGYSLDFLMSLSKGNYYLIKLANSLKRETPNQA